MSTPMQRFQAFVKERHMIYVRRQAGVPRELWTKDPILQKYRFCNIYRKLDRVTAELDHSIYSFFSQVEHQDDMIWFAAIVCRMLNEPEALKKVIVDILPFDPVWFKAKLLKRQAMGHKIRNTAYIVSTNGRAMPFLEYLVPQVLEPIWEAQPHPRPGDTLADYAALLEQFQGLGSFLVGQVIADAKYWDPVLKKAKDWKTFVVPGPGSKRGMNRLFGLDADARQPTGTFLHRVTTAQELVDEVTTAKGWPRLDAQDVQNCLCEFDKYERTFLGQSKPKQLFRPHGESA